MLDLEEYMRQEVKKNKPLSTNKKFNYKEYWEFCFKKPPSETYFS